MFTVRSIFTSFVLLVALRNDLACQSIDEASDNLTFGVTLSLGAGVGGLSYGAGASLPLSDRLLSAHYILADEIKITPGGSGYSGRELQDIGMLYGILKSSSSSFWSISLGVSYVEFHNWNPANSERRVTVGVPIEGQIFARLSHNFSVGMIAYGNINSYKLYGGALLTIRLG